MTLRKRILLFTLIVLPVLLVALYSFIQTRQQLIAQIYQERRTMASLASSILFEKLIHLEDIGLSLATGPAFCERVNNNEWDSAIKLMNKIPSNFSFIKTVFVADTFGRIRGQTPDPLFKGEQSMVMAKWNKEVQGQRRSYLSQVYKRPGDNENTYCVFVVPILNSKDIECGMLVLEVSVRELLNWSNGVSFWESGFVYIVDQSGHIAANPNYMHSGTVIDYSSVPSVQKALRGLEDVEILYNPITKEKQLSAYQQIPGYKWSVIVQQEEGAALAIFSKLRFVIFFYIIVLLAATAFAWAIIVEMEKKIQDRTTTLIKSEKRFRALIENNFDIISLMDRSFDIIYRSPSAERFTGWKNEETIGQSGSANIHPDDQEYTRKIISEVLENPGKPIATLFRYRHKKGNYIWVEGIATNLLDDENVNAILLNFRDVTDRKLAVEKIQESEANLQAIFENTSEAFIFLDKNFDIISFNANSQVLTGYSSILSLEVGKSVFNYAEPSRKEYMKETLHKALKGVSVQFDWPFKLENGKLKWYSMNVSPVVENAAITGICITGSDITVRKETEEKLANNEKRFRALVENNDGIIALLDENFANIYRSPSSERITGWSTEDRIQAGTVEQTHPDDVQAIQELSKNVLANPGKSYQISLRTKHKNGHYIWLDGIVTNMIRDPNIGAIITNFRDVTKEKEAELKLMKSEQLYRSLFENMLHGFAYLKVIFEDGVLKDAQYLAVNNEYELVLGLKDIAGKNISEVLPGLLETDASYVELITNVVLTGKPVKFETYVASLNRWLAISLYSPECGYFISLVDNISERKEAENKIKKINIELEERVARRTYELKRANEELESFSYSVSHDLRAPLRAIIGFTAILEDEYSSQLDEEANRLTGIIKSNTLKMGNLIDDLLRFSKVRGQNIDRIPMESNILLTEIVNSFEKADGATKIKWIIHHLHTVKADINALRQVWVNLISNAIKYSANRKLPTIEIKSYATDNEIVFSIKDNGVGFDQKYSGKLFKVFQRLHSSDEFEGTGVGLALVERIISKHGGNVWVDAELDNGACFYFSLPIK